MAESPHKLSSQQDSDPDECDIVRKKPSVAPAVCPDGQPQMLPTALQLVQLPEQKLEMVTKWNHQAADVYSQMRRIKEGGNDLITFEPCEESLSKTEYPRTCEVILKWLRQLLSLFPSTDTQLGNRILKTLEHLRDKDFLISVFGRFNSGKSTLLNAVLANECLPVSEQNETMMVLRIAHKRDAHPGCCKSCSNLQMCPLLEESKTHADCHIVARGTENIYEALEKFDQQVKNKQLKVTSQLTIKAHVPAIANVQEPWRVFLVDNPGFSADDDGINSLAQTAMETSHAYVLTLDYNTIEDERNAKTFQDIFKKDRRVFDDQVSRLVITVTRLDTHFHSVPIRKQLSLPDLKQKAKKLVCDAVQKAVNVHISEEKVVPVFGMWALNARLLKHQKDRQSLRQAKKDLENCFTGPSGEGQEVSADMSPKQIVEILEKESGIMQLEEEIQNMVKVFGSGWIRSVYGDCSSYVDATLKVLRDKISLLNTELMAQHENLQQSLQHQQNIADIQQELAQKMKGDSSNPVVKQLMECYIQDVKVTSDSAKEKVTEFEKKCREMLVNRCVPTKFFDSELQTLLANIILLTDEQGFLKINEEIERLRRVATRQKARLEISAKQYCSNDRASSDQPTESMSEVSPLATLVRTKSVKITKHRPKLQEIRKVYQDRAVLQNCVLDAKLERVKILRSEKTQTEQNPSFSTKAWERIKKAFTWWNTKLRKQRDADTSGSERTPTTDLQTKSVAENESEVLSVHQLEELFQGIHAEVEEILYSYFEEIQLEIIGYFFKIGYCDYVAEDLKKFYKQFAEPVKKQDEEMEVMGAVLNEMQEDIEVLTMWCNDLIGFQKLLYRQADVYHQKYFQTSQAVPHIPMVGLPESSASADARFPTTDKPDRIKTLQAVPHVQMAGLPESSASADARLLATDKPDRIKENFQTLSTTHELLHNSDASTQNEKVRHGPKVRHKPRNSGISFRSHFEAVKGRVKLYWKLARKERKQDVKFTDFPSDFKEDVLTTCKAAASRLREFNTIYPGLLAVFSEHLLQKWEQVDQKIISVALFGHLASGKSMLVNAVLTDSVLPVGKTVKSVEVRIRNNIQVHKGQCQLPGDQTCPLCPVLLELTGSRLVEQGRGANNIAKTLHDIVEPKEDEVKQIFIIEGFAPILDAACIPPWKVHLVENAGYEELKSRKETKRFETEVKAANAYIFTLPYNDRNNDVHYELLGKLIEADESVFREKRLTIVITCFEEWYEDYQRPSLQKVKDDIRCSIKVKVGQCDIPEDCLIPVCGIWANTARRLQTMPLKQLEELKQTAMGYLLIYMESDQDANEQLKPVEIASKLLAASGIKDVERRVMTMAATCSEESIAVLSSNFDRCLKEAIDYLDASSTLINEEQAKAHSQSLAREAKSLAGEAKRIKKYQDHLIELREHLEKKAEECREQLKLKLQSQVVVEV